MSLFSLSQRYNLLSTTLDKTIATLKNSTTQPTITTLTTTTPTLNINFNFVAYRTFSLQLTSNISAITFQNAVVNGCYTIYMTGTGQIVRKHLGANILNSLAGDTVVNGVFSVQIMFDGRNYMMNFVNYTA